MSDANLPGPAGPPAPLPRNVIALAAVSFFTDVSSEMIYPLLPVFLSSVLGVGPGYIGTIEGAAETTAALLKLVSGWWSDRIGRRKPLVVAGYVLASAVRPLVAIAQSAGHVLLIRIADRVGKGIRGAPRDALIADSVEARHRGRAFGLQRTGDHVGAVAGPLIAFALLQWHVASIRSVFWIAGIPAVAACVTLVVGVREAPRRATRAPEGTSDLGQPLAPPFWRVLAIIFMFTLGNSTDAFLLLRAAQLGVPVALAPILWAMLHVVKSASSAPGGALSDRVGRRPLLIAGWTLYAAVYAGFGAARVAWQAWALFAIYGVFFGLTEGTEKALITDVVPASHRGTAFGWYNLAIGLGALPASILFGVLWERFSPGTAFGTGALLALLAAAAMLVIGPRRRAEVSV
ncbi:MAG: MFS transporter [Gemmatimonadaceae bacterium]